MDYEKKYLKYKTKYNTLKNQLAGSSLLGSILSGIGSVVSAVAKSSSIGSPITSSFSTGSALSTVSSLASASRKASNDLELLRLAGQGVSAVAKRVAGIGAHLLSGTLYLFRAVAEEFDNELAKEITRELKTTEKDLDNYTKDAFSGGALYSIDTKINNEIKQYFENNKNNNDFRKVFEELKTENSDKLKEDIVKGIEILKGLKKEVIEARKLTGDTKYPKLQDIVTKYNTEASKINIILRTIYRNFVSVYRNNKDAMDYIKLMMEGTKETSGLLRPRIKIMKK